MSIKLNQTFERLPKHWWIEKGNEYQTRKDLNIYPNTEGLSKGNEYQTQQSIWTSTQTLRDWLKEMSIKLEKIGTFTQTLRDWAKVTSIRLDLKEYFVPGKNWYI